MQVVSVNVGLPRQVETPYGIVLTGIFKSPVAGRVAAMFRWGSDWMWPGQDGPTVVLQDRETGAEVRPRVIDENTGAPLDVRRTRIGRAPSHRARA